MSIGFKRALLAVVVTLVLTVLFPEMLPGPLQFAFQLTAGWALYLYHVLPQVKINWPAIATAVIATIVLLTLAQAFARRALSPSPGPPGEGRGEGLPREPDRDPLPALSIWPLRWTFSLAATVLLLFTAGLAATGLTAHTARLFTMEGEIFHFGGRGRETANRVKCMSNLRQIGQALELHAREHGGRYPAHLETIIDTEDVGGSCFVCPTADDEHIRYAAPSADVARRLRDGRATYVFLTPNLPHPTPTRIPVATEPLANHNAAGLNILFSDGSVEWHTPAEAQKILKPRAPEANTAP